MLMPDIGLSQVLPPDRPRDGRTSPLARRAAPRSDGEGPPTSGPLESPAGGVRPAGLPSPGGEEADADAARRILSVVRWPVGGIRTYLLYNYPRLLDRGYRFTFVGPADESFRAMAAELSDWPGSEFVEAPLVRGRCRLRRVVGDQIATGRYTLIHSQGFTAGAEAVLANWRRRLPHVMTSHDVLRPDQFAGAVGRLKRWTLPRLLGRVDVVISVTRDAEVNLRGYFPSLGRGRARLTVVEHGIDLEGLDAAPPEGAPGLRSSLALPPEVRLVGFLGRFMEQKGFLPLLRALKILEEDSSLPPWHLAAVGGGDYLGEYRREASRLGLADRISFLDPVTRSGPVLAQLDVLAMPSLWEAAGLLAMEALALGVPVVGSDCPGLSEVLRGSPSSTPKAGDVGLLARALGEAIRSPWRRAAEAYASIARARFDARRSADELLRWIEFAAPPEGPAQGA